jgi:3-oxoacid CoA-transferase subunit A
MDSILFRKKGDQLTKLKDIEEIKKLFKDGQTLMVGGFGLVGSPLTLINALVESFVKDLTIISNNLGEPGKGLGRLVLNKRVKKAIGSYFTSNKDVVHAYLNQELDIELIPQGTLAEAIRAGGAGIGGFYITTSVGTELSKDREKREIDGVTYVFQKPLKADVALIKAKKADTYGNLIYERSARNFNPLMATAAKTVIAEVDEVVEVGQLSPEEIITPHLYIDHIVLKEEEFYR